MYREGEKDMFRFSWPNEKLPFSTFREDPYHFKLEEVSKNRAGNILIVCNAITYIGSAKKRPI